MEHRLQTLNAAQRVQLWAERIAECRSSGKSVRAWCRENEISEKTYYYWQRRLYQQMVSTAERVDFAEIPCGGQTGQNPGAAAKICQRQCDFVVFRRTGNVGKWRVKMYSL